MYRSKSWFFASACCSRTREKDESFDDGTNEMLVKITNKCLMECNHCMEDATPSGEHMTEETFEKALRFVSQIYTHFLLISGGEPSEHPQVVDFCKLALKRFTSVTVLSNGMNQDILRQCLDTGALLQVTNDPRFYPKRVEPIDHSGATFETHLRMVSPFGRGKNLESTRQAPLCFNFRSLVRNFGSLKQAIIELRGYGKMCTPSILVDGSIVAGESRFCHKIGTVDDSLDRIALNTTVMRCNKCGLVDKLGFMHRHAIGEL